MLFKKIKINTSKKMSEMRTCFDRAQRHPGLKYIPKYMNIWDVSGTDRADDLKLAGKMLQKNFHFNTKGI